MEQKTNEQILKEIEQNRYFQRGRSFEDLEGKPTGNPKFRHRCKYCGRRRYEKDMILRSTVDCNNYKSWCTWRCIENCEPTSIRRQVDW